MIASSKMISQFLINQGEMLIGAPFLHKSVIPNANRLKYIPPKLSSDVVEISPEVLKKSKLLRLQELAQEDLSLNTMSSKLNMPMRRLRYHLYKYNIETNDQKKYKALKEYFCAETKEEKAKAFAQVDKYLEQIAKKEFKTNKSNSYEDCLQDVRLRFFEIVDKRKKDGIDFPYHILKTTENSCPQPQKEFQTVELPPLKNANTDKNLQVLDDTIERFEDTNFEKQVLDYVNSKTGSYLHARAGVILKYIQEGKPIKEISRLLKLTSAHTEIILDNALTKIRSKLSPITSNEHLHARSNFGCKTINDIEKQN